MTIMIIFHLTFYGGLLYIILSVFVSDILPRHAIIKLPAVCSLIITLRGKYTMRVGASKSIQAIRDAEL